MRVEQKFLFILTSVCFLVATLIANTPVIAEEDLAQCASKKVRFDGVEPLAYSDIVGESGAHIALSYQYPKLCNSQYGQECQGRAYLIPGDTVAVAKSCGDSSYVQFMGQKKITIGWVSKIHLKNRVAKLPYDDGAPPGYNHFFTPSAATMTLTKGQGRPVCEAYLQRLNQTVYYEPPYCGRPENDQVPGFVRLHRIILDPDEVSKLYGQVGAFLLRSNSTPPQVQNAQEMEEVSRAAGSHKILVWRYEPRVDVENDGTTTNLIVWTGSPISSTGKACGDPHFPNGDPASAGYVRKQLVLVLFDDRQHLDDDKTKELFAHPTRGRPVPDREPYRDTSSQYKAIGTSMGVFQYRNDVYFDTFFDGDGWADFYGQRARLASLRNHLGVFFHQRGATQQVCEYLFDVNQSPGFK